MKQSTGFIIFLLIFSSFRPYAAGNNCIKPLQLVNQFKQYHYSPLKLDDELSERVYALFFEQIDPAARYLSSEELNGFLQHKYEIDNYISKKSCAFITEVETELQNKLIFFQQWLDVQNLQDYDFLEKEEMHFSKRRSLANNKVQLFKGWQKHLKYDFLKEFAAIDSAGNHPDAQEAWDSVISRYKCDIDKILNHPDGFDEYIFSKYLNAIALAHDPHSFFLPQYEKRQFDASVAMKAEGFGITVSNNMMREIIVEHMIPGGPAWNSEQIEKGDIIVDMVCDNQKIELHCMDLYEIQAILNASPYKKIKLKIKKKNGSIEGIELHRAAVKLENNTLKSFILKGPVTLGYISVPSFYTSQDNATPKGLTDDLAKELFMLKKEKIKGLILDLRGNGGGSLLEAISMAGVFIDKGPVISIETNTGETQVIRDFNRGKLYSDPLLILVNSSSASASELFAGCMQNYNRGIVVGSATFGKSTVQRMFPAFYEKNQDAFVNITTEVFYRINGESHQNKGIIPDIALPDIYKSLLDSEKELSHTIQAPLKEKLSYITDNVLPLIKLKELSTSRVASHESFTQINLIGDSLMNLNKFSLSLDSTKFLHELSFLSTFFGSMETLSFKEHSTFKADIPKHVDYELSYNDIKRENYEFVNKFIVKDIYVEESYQILTDFIKNY